MTLQQKSILQDKNLAGTEAVASVSSSGLQTPKVTHAIRYDDESKSISEESTEVPGDSFEFPAPPLYIEV